MKRPNLRLPFAAFAALSLALAPSPGGAVSLDPPASGSGFRPDEVISFSLEGRELGSLYFEINDVDVSGFVQSDEGRAAIQLPTPLEPGLYEVRVLSSEPDGSLIELGVYTFEVRQSVAFRQASWHASASVESPWRIASHNVETRGVSESQVRGAFNLGGEAAGEDWSARVQAPIAFDHDRGFVSDSIGRDWDLGAFLVEAQKGRANLRLGHLSPAPASLILEGFHRRGASVGIDLPEVASRIEGFTLQTEPITGFREGLGVGNTEQRVTGVTVQGQPIQFESAVIDLAATWLHGHTTSPPFGAGLTLLGGQPRQSGTAWSMRADGVFLDQDLRVRTEYAQTRYDPFDGGLGVSNDDDAWSLLIEVRPWWDFRIDESPIESQFAYEHRRVGPLFRSVANPGAPVDREFHEVRGNVRWASFDLRASAAREEDNVEDLDALPSFRTERWQANFGWSPQFDDEPPEWLGRPRFGLNLSGEQTDPLQAPDSAALAAVIGNSVTTVTNSLGAVVSVFPGAAAIDPAGPTIVRGGFFNPFGPIPQFALADRAFQSGSLEVSTSYGWGSVSISHGIDKFDDRTNASADSRTDMSALQLNFRIGEKGQAGMRLQRQRERFTSLGFRRTNWLANANLNWTFNEDLTGALMASVNRSEDSTDTLDQRFTMVTGRLDWTALRPEDWKPGFSLSLYGTWTDQANRIFDIGHGDDLQVFLEARMTWRGGSR